MHTCYHTSNVMSFCRSIHISLHKCTRSFSESHILLTFDAVKPFFQRISWHAEYTDTLHSSCAKCINSSRSRWIARLGFGVVDHNLYRRSVAASSSHTQNVAATLWYRPRQKQIQCYKGDKQDKTILQGNNYTCSYNIKCWLSTNQFYQRYMYWTQAAYILAYLQ